MREPRFWVGGLTRRIYMTQHWRADDNGDGYVMVCTGQKYDVTDAVLAVAAQRAAAIKDE
jgi:hypothetical protein